MAAGEGTRPRRGEFSGGFREPELLSIDRQESRFVRLQKNVGVATKLHMMELHGKRVRPVMVTPTYRPGVRWSAAHIATYIDHVRKWFKRRTGDALRYVWVAESQDGSRREDGVGRDVIHYHCIFFIHRGLTMPKADKQGWWPHGMTNTVACKAPVAYVMSYAKKLASKRGIPKRARLYGIGGLSKESRSIRRWVNWPSFIQARAAVTDSYGRQPGGGWVNKVTGEWWPSEYALAFTTRGQAYVWKLRDHGRPISGVVGPYSWVAPP